MNDRDEFLTRKFKTDQISIEKMTKEEFDFAKSTESEILKIFQALLLSICMLLLSYHSVRYGRTEYSILENGEITEGYAHKAVVTLSLGYSTPYAIVSFLAIGMLAYSLISVRNIDIYIYNNLLFPSIIVLNIQSLNIVEKSTLEYSIYSTLSCRPGLQYQWRHRRNLVIFLSFPIRNSLVLHVRNDFANTYVFTIHRLYFLQSLNFYH